MQPTTPMKPPAPLTPSPTPAPPVQTPQILRESAGMYQSGPLHMAATPAVLRLVGSRLQLFTMDPQTGHATTQLVDIDMHEITKASFSSIYLSFTASGQRYVVNLNPAGQAAMALGGVGLIIADQTAKTSELAWWRETLKTAGVPLADHGAGNSMKLSAIIAVGIIILLVAITMLSSKN